MKPWEKCSYLLFGAENISLYFHYRYSQSSRTYYRVLNLDSRVWEIADTLQVPESWGVKFSNNNGLMTGNKIIFLGNKYSPYFYHIDNGNWSVTLEGPEIGGGDIVAWHP